MIICVIEIPESDPCEFFFVDTSKACSIAQHEYVRVLTDSLMEDAASTDPDLSLLYGDLEDAGRLTVDLPVMVNACVKLYLE